MGRINVEIPDETHTGIRVASAKEQVAMKQLIIEALREKYGIDIGQTDVVDNNTPDARV